MLADVTEIEDQLRALGERWSHACQWTLARLARLRAAVAAEARAHELERELKEVTSQRSLYGATRAPFNIITCS